MKKHSLPLLLALLTLPIVTASAQLIGYTDGSQVNVLNAYNATLAISGTNAGSTITPDQARFFADGGALIRTTTSNPAATLDFGTARTVKTISTVQWFNYGFTAATVETSTDGTNWTTYTGGTTVTATQTGSVDGGTYNLVTLNSSVNARYVRLTPTAFQNGGGAGTDHRWYLDTMRAFGDTGALAGDTNLSIIQNGAFSQTQTLSPIGSIGEINPEAMIAPATSPYPPRPILYSMGNNEGFQLNLGQTFAVDAATMEMYHMSTAPLTLTLSGSTDGTNFSQLYTTTWTPAAGKDYLNFSFLAGNAKYLNVVFNSTDTDIRVTDFAFFQSVPEPSTVALAALGVSAVLFRLRRKQRAE